MNKKRIQIKIGSDDYAAANRPILILDLMDGNFMGIDGIIHLYVPVIANLLNSELGKPIVYNSEEAAKVKPDIICAKSLISQLSDKSKLLSEKCPIKVSIIPSQIIPNIHGCLVAYNVMNFENQVIFKKYKNEYKLSFSRSGRPLSHDSLKQILDTICKWYIQRNNDSATWVPNKLDGRCPWNIVNIAAMLHPSSLPLIEVIDS